MVTDRVSTGARSTAPNPPSKGLGGSRAPFAVPEARRAHSEARRRESAKSDRSVGVLELLGLRVGFLPGLLPTTIHLRSEQGTRFVFTTSRSGFARAKQDNVPVFVGGEMLALGRCAERGLVDWLSMEAHLERKVRNASWRFVAPRLRGVPKLTFAELCWELDSWIDSVEVGA